MATVFVTRGFKAKLTERLNDSEASFKEVVSLLTFQPSVIAHLLRMANDVCHQYRSSNKPVTIEGIINILGLGNIPRILDDVVDVPFAQSKETRERAVESFVLAKVLAEFAETRLGKRQAPEFFLTGLLASAFVEDEALLMSCNEDLIWRFRSKQSPNLTEARELIRGFAERGANVSMGGLQHAEYARLKKVWEEAIRYTQHVLGH